MQWNDSSTRSLESYVHEHTIYRTGISFTHQMRRIFKSYTVKSLMSTVQGTKDNQIFS